MSNLFLFDPDAGDHSPKRDRITTVRELINTFLQRASVGQSETARIERIRLLQEFCNYRGNTPIDDLIPDDLEGWIESHASWQSDWTRLRVATTIKRPFAWALRKGLIDRHPFAACTFPPGQRGKPMADTIFRTMLRKSKLLFRRVLLFLRWTGCRPCELSRLEWTHIDTTSGVAVLYIHKTSRTRKDRAPRVIVLPDCAVRLLTAIRREQQPDEKFVFTNARGRPWTKNALTLRIHYLRRKLSIDPSVKLYGLRHQFATQLACSGCDLASLAAILGHTTVAMAEHYVHVAGRTEHLRRQIERGLK